MVAGSDPLLLSKDDYEAPPSTGVQDHSLALSQDHTHLDKDPIADLQCDASCVNKAHDKTFHCPFKMTTLIAKLQGENATLVTEVETLKQGSADDGNTGNYQSLYFSLVAEKEEIENTVDTWRAKYEAETKKGTRLSKRLQETRELLMQAELKAKGRSQGDKDTSEEILRLRKLLETERAVTESKLSANSPPVNTELKNQVKRLQEELKNSAKISTDGMDEMKKVHKMEIENLQNSLDEERELKDGLQTRCTKLAEDFYAFKRKSWKTDDETQIQFTEEIERAWTAADHAATILQQSLTQVIEKDEKAATAVKHAEDKLARKSALYDSLQVTHESLQTKIVELQKKYDFIRNSEKLDGAFNKIITAAMKIDGVNELPPVGDKRPRETIASSAKVVPIASSGKVVPISPPREAITSSSDEDTSSESGDDKAPPAKKAKEGGKKSPGKSPALERLKFFFPVMWMAKVMFKTTVQGAQQVLVKRVPLTGIDGIWRESKRIDGVASVNGAKEVNVSKQTSNYLFFRWEEMVRHGCFTPLSLEEIRRNCKKSEENELVVMMSTLLSNYVEIKVNNFEKIVLQKGAQHHSNYRIVVESPSQQGRPPVRRFMFSEHFGKYALSSLEGAKCIDKASKAEIREKQEKMKIHLKKRFNLS